MDLSGVATLSWLARLSPLAFSGYLPEKLLNDPTILRRKAQRRRKGNPATPHYTFRFNHTTSDKGGLSIGPHSRPLEVFLSPDLPYH